ncbi:putative ammonium transporter 3-like protein [Leptotrombidium deliense]|uniref:Putative ammonium transporter 3-like protein n=1 Tax=Leptotrombidium deliense TaxID=299467 RepID=A0A443SJR6_9ACAR|nr:putative ammonium transporter 3-like protein [Leptotrombidium deliense]
MSTDLETAVDTVWILTATVIIFFMQSGFALLESGVCAPKNHVNIMMKNIIDIVIGGFVYWSIGYGLQYGMNAGTNAFCGFGDFFIVFTEYKTFLHFVFQLSFSSTTITIVSGAMAERCNFNAYCILCATFVFVYCIPSGWLWRKNGFLNTLGAVDYCGAAGVHLVGGIASLVAAFKLKPRRERYKHGWKTSAPKPGNAVNAILGTTILWWGFLFFNAGTSFGVTDGLWKIASRAFIITILSSIFGGITALLYCNIFVKYIDVFTITNAILTSMVAVCGCAALIETYDAIYIGIMACIVSILFSKLLDRLQIDDPVGAIAVHAGGGIFGTLVVGLSLDFDANVAASVAISKSQKGLFKNGGIVLMGKQIVALLCITVWTAVTVFLIFLILDYFVKIRMSQEEEVIGGDLWVHGLPAFNFDFDTVLKETDYDVNKVIKRMNVVGYEKHIQLSGVVIANESVVSNNCVLKSYNEITLNPINLSKSD